MLPSQEFVNYEDVKDESTKKYFNNNTFSINTFNEKYQAVKNETYVQAIKRVCDEIASVEKTQQLRKYWSERWFSEIYNDWWHPAGSIIRGANCNKKISLANCTTISMGNIDNDTEWDNLESIISNVAYTTAKCAAYRQGSGIDFSRLRPRDTTILNSANNSSGVVHWMKFIDSIGYYVGQKGRIPAILISLSCTHPDLLEFIDSKKDFSNIQNANISVQCTDKFYEAIKNNTDWKLTFVIPEVKLGQQVYVDQYSTNIGCCYDAKLKKHYYIATHNRKLEKITKIIRARKILELIAEAMLRQAEPGIQNIDIACKWSNSDYVYDEEDVYNSKIISTNACSEQYLSKDSVCILSSINHGRFSTDKQEYEEQLKEISLSINRFLDNVNSVEVKRKTYAVPSQRVAIEKLRRTGAGITNIGEWLLKNNQQYGSDEANVSVSKFVERYNYHLYKSSIELGKEKGNFQLFNRKKLEKSPFIQHMMDLGLKFTSLRNITCSSIAPSGTISLMFRRAIMSYGVEPGFGLYYWKRTRMSGQYEYYFYVPQIVKEMYKNAGYEIPMDNNSIKDTWDGKYGIDIATFINTHEKKIGIKFKPPQNVDYKDKLNLMEKLMKNIDSSISVTYSLPENSTSKRVYNFILEAHEKGIKSVTAYPHRKMYGIVSDIPFQNLALQLIQQKIDINSQNFSDEESQWLNDNSDSIFSKNHITPTLAPKRPKILKCDVHHTSIQGRNYFVLVGLLNNNEPYEVFAGKNGFLPKKIDKGKIIRKRKGYYIAEFDDSDLQLSPITASTDELEEIITRLTSMSLRHGADIHFIVKQLEQVGEQTGLNSFAKGVGRILKKYIKDGTKETGLKCPNCDKMEIIRVDGCITCCNCQWSQCT